jgi:hypothetical protein
MSWAISTPRLLKQIATGGGTLEASRLTEEFGRRRTKLKTGTILMREWNAQAYSGDSGGRGLCLERQDL